MAADQHQADSIVRAHIWRRASRLAQPFLDEEAWTARAEEMTRQCLPDCRIQVLDAGVRVVGFAAMRGEHLEALFVDPKFQGYGHGSALMAHVMSLSERITLRVFSRNVRAVSFYRRLGFHAYLETEDPTSGEPETLMVWTRHRS